MNAKVTCSAMFAAALIVLLGGSPANTAELPRYTFEVGQQLTYQSTSTYTSKRGSRDTNKKYVIWVAAKNDDGSWRLIVQDSRVLSSSELTTAFVYVDLAPDGTYQPNPTLGPLFDPTSVFLPLPKDEQELEKGWQGTASFDTTIDCHQDADAEAKDDMCVFDFERNSPMNEIYLVTSTGQATFNTERGLIEQIDTASTQRYGIESEGTGKTTLESTETKTPEWMSDFYKEATAYFEASQRSDDLLEKAADSEDSDAVLQEAKQLLEDGKEQAANELVVKLYERQLKSFDGKAKYYAENAKRLAEVLDKPAFEFETTGLNGQKYALKDYRGKVVVLDFWYRGCGWCIRAMPQMKELAETFSDQPVQIFGMNTDKDEENALFVIEKMQLNYPSLKAEGLPKEYHVRGFPTLLIIDKQGVVRDVHVGYSANLAEEVGSEVRKLLAEEQQAGM